MNAKERKQICYLNYAALDAQILERFGVESSTGYNLFAGRVVTTLPDKTPKKKAKQALAFAAGWSEGQAELANRLSNPETYIG